MTAMEKSGMAASNAFENMNLIALRKYACVTADKKKNEWYLECVGCEKKGCAVGKRVAKILEDTTKPAKNQIQKFNERMNKHAQAERRKTLEEALKHDDPYQWLADQGLYKNRQSAYASARDWTKKNAPDLVPLYLNHPIAERNIKARNSIVTRKKAEAFVKRVEQIFDGVAEEDRAMAVLRREDRDRIMHSAASKIYQWKISYPEMNKKYGLDDVARKLSNIDTTYDGRNRTVGEILDMLEKETEMKDLRQDTDGDEVSLVDFLQEVSPETGEAETKIRLLPETPKPGAEKADSTEALRRTFSDKKADMMNKKNALKETIRKAEEAIRTLDEQIRTLDQAALIFGMVPKNSEKKEVV